MADDDDVTRGYPLREALERFADPEKWRAFAEVADAKQPGRPSAWLPQRHGWLSHPSGTPKPGVADPAQEKALWLRKQRAWEALLADFRARLVSGELIASGYEAPIRLDSQRVDAPREKWESLRFRFRHSSARWRELELREILVRRAADRDDSQPAAAEARQEDAATALSSGPKRPGPRTFIPQAEEELRAMARCRLLTGSLKADSHTIAERVAARFPDQKACCPKTIRNRLNKLYRHLYRAQCAQNNSGNY